MTVDELTTYLRHRVIGLLHVNAVGPGDRLPSIRETSETLDADHRAVAKAYRRLEEEGLVEVRPASGVYVAGEERARSGLASATTDWIADVFLAGWRRRIPRGEVGEMMERAGTSTLRCACVESVRDHMVALAAEMEEDFGFEVERIYLEDGGEGDDDARADRIERIARADLAVTLHFEAGRVRALAREASTPLVVVTTNPELAREIDAILREEPVTAVVADRRTLRRMRDHFDVTVHRDAVHPVLAGELDSLEDAEEAGRRVLATRAARRELDAADYHILPGRPTLVSPESAREIFEVVARLTG